MEDREVSLTATGDSSELTSSTMPATSWPGRTGYVAPRGRTIPLEQV